MLDNFLTSSSLIAYGNSICVITEDTFQLSQNVKWFLAETHTQTTVIHCMKITSNRFVFGFPIDSLPMKFIQYSCVIINNNGKPFYLHLSFHGIKSDLTMIVQNIYAVIRYCH